jgi:hypothetical protein
MRRHSAACRRYSSSLLMLAFIIQIRPLSKSNYVRRIRNRPVASGLDVSFQVSDLTIPLGVGKARTRRLGVESQAPLVVHCRRRHRPRHRDVRLRASVSYTCSWISYTHIWKMVARAIVPRAVVCDRQSNCLQTRSLFLSGEFPTDIVSCQANSTYVRSSFDRRSWPASRIGASPSRRFSPDRSAKVCVIARDFESSFLRALRSPPEIGGW